MDTQTSSKLSLLLCILRFPLVSMLVLYFSLMTACVLIAMALGIYRIDGLDSWHNLLPTGVASIALVYGPMLTAPFMLTRRLWMSIGLHGAWNYTMGEIFSISVSGVAAQGLIKVSFEGPELLTGGSAGMEGSLIGIVVGITATVLMLGLAVRRGNIVPPPWQRKSAGQRPVHAPGIYNHHVTVPGHKGLTTGPIDTVGQARVRFRL